MREEMLHLMPQKQRVIRDHYVCTKLVNLEKNGYIPRNTQCTKTES